MESLLCDDLAALILQRLCLRHRSMLARTSKTIRSAVQPAIKQAEKQRNLAYSATAIAFNHIILQHRLLKSWVGIPSMYHTKNSQRVIFSDAAGGYHGSVFASTDGYRTWAVPEWCMQVYSSNISICTDSTTQGLMDVIIICIVPLTETTGHLMVVHSRATTSYGYNRGVVAALRTLGF